MNYPTIDPVIFDLGFLSVRWYGLMYVFAFAIFYWLGSKRLGASATVKDKNELLDLLFYSVLGVALGGRIGYVLFYEFGAFLADPLWLFKIWEGGMSFHGGLLGVLVALWVWSRMHGIRFLAMTDFVAPLVPPGLGLGRIGNFINTELPGRVTESFLGVHFPCYSVQSHARLCVGEFEEVTRHVSSLYQAIAEGLVLFILLWFVSRSPRRLGTISGLFLIAYAIARLVTELFRMPDAHIGYLAGETVTLGQLLCVPLLVAGIVLLLPAVSRFIDARPVPVPWFKSS